MEIWHPDNTNELELSPRSEALFGEKLIGATVTATVTKLGVNVAGMTNPMEFDEVKPGVYKAFASANADIADGDELVALVEVTKDDYHGEGSLIITVSDRVIGEAPGSPASLVLRVIETEADIAALEAGVTAAEADITALQSEVDDLQADVLVQFGESGDDATDARTAIQAKVDAATAGSVLTLTGSTGYYLASEPIYINKALRVRVEAPIRTGTWGVPAFIVDSADVVFETPVRIRYTGARSDISSLPSSADSRVQAIYDEVGASDARILCTGIYARRKVDRLTVPHLNVFGLFAGITFVGLVSATTYDPDDVSLGDLVLDTLDWGVLVGGGFKNMTIHSIKARNVTNVTGDPAHAVYVGPRNVGILNEQLTIGSIDVDGGATVADSDSLNNGADAFSIRSTRVCYIGPVKVRNLQLIGNANVGANVTIQHIDADLLEFVAGTTSELYALFSQGGAKITVQGYDITARPRCNGTLRTGVFQSSGSGSSMYLKPGRVRIATTANPGIVGRFTGDKYDIRQPEIIYDNPISTNLAAGDQWPFIFIAPASRIEMHFPSLVGTTRLATITTQDDHLFVIDPNLFHSGADSNTIVTNTGNYRVSFTSFRRSPSVLTDGATSLSMHGCNTYQTNNSTARTITAMPRGTDGQMYMLIAGDANTTIQHTGGALVTKTGANIAAGAWAWVVFLRSGGVMYEVQRA